VLWILHRADNTLILRSELVGFTDAVELELFGDSFLRRRWRFLRDVEARRYADRLRGRLIARGFEQRRLSRGA
jgi:hypothetical protein